MRKSAWPKRVAQPDLTQSPFSPYSVNDEVVSTTTRRGAAAARPLSVASQ
jgi:hypothetical protein